MYDRIKKEMHENVEQTTSAILNGFTQGKENEIDFEEFLHSVYDKHVIFINK